MHPNQYAIPPAPPLSPEESDRELIGYGILAYSYLMETYGVRPIAELADVIQANSSPTCKRSQAIIAAMRRNHKVAIVRARPGLIIEEVRP